MFTYPDDAAPSRTPAPDPHFALPLMWAQAFEDRLDRREQRRESRGTRFRPVPFQRWSAPLHHAWSRLRSSRPDSFSGTPFPA